MKPTIRLSPRQAVAEMLKASKTPRNNSERKEFATIKILKREMSLR